MGSKSTYNQLEYSLFFFVFSEKYNTTLYSRQFESTEFLRGKFLKFSCGSKKCKMSHRHLI